MEGGSRCKKSLNPLTDKFLGGQNFLKIKWFYSFKKQPIFNIGYGYCKYQTARSYYNYKVVEIIQGVSMKGLVSQPVKYPPKRWGRFLTTHSMGCQKFYKNITFELKLADIYTKQWRHWKDQNVKNVGFWEIISFLLPLTF